MEPRCLGIIFVSARLIDGSCLLITWRGYRYRRNHATADGQQDWASILRKYLPPSAKLRSRVGICAQNMYEETVCPYSQSPRPQRYCPFREET